MVDHQRRDAVRSRLLELAEDDPQVSGAAVTGSYALGRQDAWSDIDLALGVDDQELGTALDRWAGIMITEFDAVHHWDLPAGDWIYRVFLLPDGIEVDLGFAPITVWGPRAESWQPIFGDPAPLTPAAVADDESAQRTLIGHLWHHTLHARACIERGKLWQAEYWISAARDLVIESACRRHGLPTSYARGAHQVPSALTAALEPTLVRSTGAGELRRALSAVVAAVIDELRELNPELAGRFAAILDGG